MGGRVVKRIESSEISVVVQGPIGHTADKLRECARTLESVRTYLPDAELVLSTWEGEAVESLDYDLVVRSADPGCWIDNNGRPCNLNRQILSTTAGLKACTRKYALKLRVDTPLHSDAMCVIGTEGPTHFFSERVTMSNIVLRNPLRFPQLLSLSDLCQFGAREDLMLIWDVPLARADETRRKSYPKIPLRGNFIGYSSLRVVPEQYPLECLAIRAMGVSRLPDPNEISLGLMRRYEEFLFGNFLILDYRQCGVSFPRRTWSPSFVADSFYTTDEIAAVRELLAKSERAYMVRFARTWCNKYLFSWFRLAYLVPLASHVLFRYVPGVASKARRAFHLLRGDMNFGSGARQR